MNVLSLFDGMSCGQLALLNAGIFYDSYFASEIDLASIQVTMANFPQTKQVGDVTSIESWMLPKIDLLIGGSPCQGFSFAGNKLNFDDPRSALFFEYLRLLDECKPKYFFLENVKMKQEYQNTISSYLGVQPIEINSSVVSAQDRKRLYWTNIFIGEFVTTNIAFKDILESEVDYSYFLDISISNRYIPICYKKKTTKSCVCGKLSKYQGDRIFDTDCKASSLSAGGGNNAGGGCNIIWQDSKLRRISPIECERLQTIPDGYTSQASKVQRYKMLGNGWTVDVISHIFSGIKT